MGAINAFNCGNNTGNTGINDCVFQMSEMVGAIFVPKSLALTPTQLSTLKTTLSALVIQADKTKRIYPIGRFVELKDDSTEPTSDSTGYGIENIVKDGVYKWMFSYNNGLCFHKSVMTFRNQQNRFNVLLVDRKGATWGTKDADGNLKGFSLSQIYPNNATLPDGTKTTWNTISLTLADATEFNMNLAFIYDDTFSPMSELEGLIDVELAQYEPATATTVSIAPTINCGGTNLVDLFATELASPTMWVFTNTATGAPVIASAVAAVTGKGFKATLTAATGLTITVALAAPSVLEGAGITAPNGNYLEGNTIRVIVP